MYGVVSERPILSPWKVVGNSNEECVKTNLLVKSKNKLNCNFQRGKVKLFFGRMKKQGYKHLPKYEKTGFLNTNIQKASCKTIYRTPTKCNLSVLCIIP